MAIVQCLYNHYYDDKKNSSCPYCEKMQNAVTGAEELNEKLTSYISPADADEDIQLTEGYGESVSEFDKTIGIFMDESHNLLTAAWLVCVEGSEKGKSYVIHSGRNFAGRSLNMDIVLSDDLSIAREKHFSIVYDPKSIVFYLVAGAGHTYVNGDAVLEERTLEEGDILVVGNSRYIFVPFCKEGREWD